jgi:small-conductance mechanosensitive channel
MIFSPSAWLTPFFNTPLWRAGGVSITLGWIISILVLFIFVTCLTIAFKSLLKNRLLKSLGFDEGNREAIATLSSFAFGAFGYIIALQLTGFNLASIAVLAGGLGVGIGFGLQELTKNLTSGLTLLVERKLKVGDFIEFEQTKGYIREISIRFTTILTIDGAELIVPNTILTSNRVQNWHYPDSRIRVIVPVGVAYGTDPLVVTEILLQSAYMSGEIAFNPPPKVIFNGFGDSALNFELWVWVEKVERAVFLRSSLHFIIEHNLRHRGITIPFPQRELWLRNASSFEAVSDTNQDGMKPSMLPSLKEMLLEVSYFQHFNDLQLRILIEMGCRKHLNDGEILIRQGERTNYFCIILQGQVDAIYENENFSRKVFTFIKGQYFGELPLMLEAPYPTTMQAVGETLLFLLDRQGFQHLIATYPALAEEFAQALAQRQEELQQCQESLRAMGLLATEDLKNPVTWLRGQLKRFFAPV